MTMTNRTTTTIAIVPMTTTASLGTAMETLPLMSFVIQIHKRNCFKTRYGSVIIIHVPPN